MAYRVLLPSGGRISANYSLSVPRARGDKSHSAGDATVKRDGVPRARGDKSSFMKIALSGRFVFLSLQLIACMAFTARRRDSG